jgi:hypothetical protein
MIRKYLMLIIVLVVILFAGCKNSPNNLQNSSKLNVCEDLANALDKSIVDSNNPPGRFIISSFEGIVGGTLTDIMSKGTDRGYNSYTLTFKGIDSHGELYLLTSSNKTLPYQIGQFFQFDLENRNRFSAALSGSFIDNDLDRLIIVKCRN